MKFKKRINGSWIDIPYYINATMTDNLTILPATLYTDNSEIVVGVKGNAIQSSVPMPESPVMPHGTGERTGNLIPEYPAQTKTLDGVNWNVSPNGKITGNGTTTSGTNFYLFSNYSIPLKAGTYTLSFVGRKNITLILRNVTTMTTICAVWSTNSSATFTIDDDIPGTDRINLYFNASQTGVSVDIDGYPMLNLGSTALPYEPYGYKLDISCGDTLTPIYLGEVASTRKIKKLVLTGEENFVYDSNYTRFRFTMPNSLILGVRRTPIICTHYEAITDGRPIEEVTRNTIYSDSARQDRWWIEAEGFTSANDFKAYLAAQYAAGTPVIIWYILTEPETAIVNEPLMKIGDYADEIINVNVPTIVGTNVFNVDTTVQPSEVALHYHGWHPINNVHEHDNGEWN